MGGYLSSASSTQEDPTKKLEEERKMVKSVDPASISMYAKKYELLEAPSDENLFMAILRIEKARIQKEEVLDLRSLNLTSLDMCYVPSTVKRIIWGSTKVIEDTNSIQ